LNAISDKTLAKLFNLWRDGIIVNKKILKPIVDFEIKSEQNQLKKNDEKEDEFYYNDDKDPEINQKQIYIPKELQPPLIAEEKKV